MRRWKQIAWIVGATLVALWLIKPLLMSFVLSHKLKVPVSIGTIGIWPTSTHIGNFEITNPRGFHEPHALSAGSIDVQYRLGEIVSDPSTIQFIELDNIDLVIEFTNPLGTQNNWTEILSNIPKGSGNNEVIIERLVITNLRVEIRGLGLTGKTQVKTLDRIEFTNINSQDGFPTAQLVSELFGKAGVMQYIQDAVSPLLQRVAPNVPMIQGF